MNAFDAQLLRHRLTLNRDALVTLQLNLGRQCNQACRHCHVDAAPWRTETMSREVAERVSDWIERFRPAVVDLTGGAPELCKHFRMLVQVSRAHGARVMDRNNLTILEEPGFEDLPEFLAANEVEVVASLPCYSEDNVNRQRGAGVFERSIRGLRRLNALGYGTRLQLDLVYNPVGPKLPGPQPELEADYQEELFRNFGIRFHRLYTITNQPIARFAEDLRRQGAFDAYMELLANSFNPATVAGLMCRTTLSVGYDGSLYDCDFNQMLNLSLPPAGGSATERSGRFLWDLNPEDLNGRSIRTGPHCLACTAGSGSSCTGQVITA